MRKLQINSLQDLLAILSRRKWWLLVPFVLLALGAGVLSIVIPDIYVSDALIAIDRRDIPDNMVPNLMQEEIDQRLNMIQQTVLSRTNLMEVYRGYQRQLDSTDQLNDEQRYTRLRDRIDIEFSRFDRGSAVSLFRISYADTDPELAQAITRELSNRFIKEHERSRNAQVLQTSEFFKDEVERVQAEMQDVDDQLRAKKEQYRYELPEHLDANLRTLDRLSDDLRTASDRIDRAQSRRLQLERELSETPRTITEQTGPASAARQRQVSPLVKEYRDKSRELDQLETQYTANHPDVKRLREQVETLRSKIPPEDLALDEDSLLEQSEPIPLPNPEYQKLLNSVDDVKTELAVLERERGDIRSQMATYQQRVENAPRREQELASLRRYSNYLYTKYQNLTEKQDDAELASNMENQSKGERFRVMDPARLPLAPDKPNRLLIALVGLVGSLGLGIVLALGRDFLEQRFYNYREVEDFFNIPILVEIPQILTKRDQKRVRRDRWAALAVLLTLLVVTVGSLYWVGTSSAIQQWGTQHLQAISRMMDR